MENDRLAQFEGQNYLNLETFRKNGAGVKTPVWFAQQRDTFYVYTLANSGKVKRVRNNPRVRVAPCDMRGGLKGDWVEAQARIVTGDEVQLGHQLLNQKYWMKRIGDVFSKLRGRKQAVLAIRIP